MNLIADGQSPFTTDWGNNIITPTPEALNNIIERSSSFSATNSALSSSHAYFLNIAHFSEYLLGHAQILATIVAVGFSIYTFVLGMKVSRLALKLILKKEKVVIKFGLSLLFIGFIVILSAFPYENMPFGIVLGLFILTILFYILPAYWLVNLSQSLSSYLSPDSIIKLIKENLSKSIVKGYIVETGQLKIKQRFDAACEKAGIDILPGFASLYEAERQIAIKANRQGYINSFDQSKIEKIGQLLQPIVTSQAVADNAPHHLQERQTNKVRIYHTIGSYTDPSSINQSLNIIASVDNRVENKKLIAELLSSLFEVKPRNPFASEINDLLVDLKNHILELVKDRNLDEYKESITIFPALLVEHYKQCQGSADKQSLSYLGPIREIIAELLEKTLQIKSPSWIGSTVMLFYSMLSLAIENEDDALFQQFITLFRTLYNLSYEFKLKESLWTSHHLFYEILNYHLIPKLEADLKKHDDTEDRQKDINKAKSFIWSIIIILSENLKKAYQLGDSSYTTSVIKMLKGSLKYFGENEDVAEFEQLKEWYKQSLIKLWFNQLGYTFVMHDKRSKNNKEIFKLLISATNEYSLEEMSFVAASDRNEEEAFSFPDFSEIMFDEESEYSGTAVFMGDLYISKFKAYAVSAISRNELANQKSVPISQYYHDELKKVTESFESGAYPELVDSFNADVISAFKQINDAALNEFTTQTEQSIIDSSLDVTLISRFKDNVLRGWSTTGSIRFLLKSHKKVIRKLNECPPPSDDVMLRGFNQRHSKEYFIAQDRFGYPKDYGYEYGKAISEGEDLLIYEKLISSVSSSPLKVKGKSAEQILDKIFNAKKPQRDSVLFVPFDFWEFQYRNSKKFIPKYSLPASDKLKELGALIGYFEYDGVKVPMMYSPERKRKNNKLVFVNMGHVGKLTIYKPHQDSEPRKEIYADIKLFTDTELQQIITANPSDLNGLTDEAKKKKLNQEVGLKALERYKFEVLDNSNVNVFTLEGIDE